MIHGHLNKTLSPLLRRRGEEKVTITAIRKGTQKGTWSIEMEFPSVNSAGDYLTKQSWDASKWTMRGQGVTVTYGTVTSIWVNFF